MPPPCARCGLPLSGLTVRSSRVGRIHATCVEREGNWALLTDCPKCKAQPHEHCVGRAPTKSHHERWRAAARAGLRPT